jgi:hypothetical protein
MTRGERVLSEGVTVRERGKEREVAEHKRCSSIWLEHDCSCQEEHVLV